MRMAALEYTAAMRIILRLLRSFLFMLMAAAIPVQGFAAQLTASCAHCRQSEMSLAAVHEHCKAPATVKITQHEQCDEHCAACAAASSVTGLRSTGAGFVALELPLLEAMHYHPAYFYRLAAPPLERPPLFHCA